MSLRSSEGAHESGIGSQMKRGRSRLGSAALRRRRMVVVNSMQRSGLQAM